MAFTAKAVVHVDQTTAAPPGAVYDPLTFTYGTYGTYQPDGSTTGLPTGLSQSALQVVTATNGDYVITDAVAAAAGYKWDSIWFQCRVVIKTAAALTFARSWFDGKAATGVGSIGSIDCNNSPGTNYNVGVYDSVITAAIPSIFNSGVVGHDFILARCNLFGLNDGVQLGTTLSGGTNAHGTLYGNWFHDFAYFSPDTTNGTSERLGTHNDCVQWFGGSGFTHKGNFFDGHMNPTIGAASLDQAHRNPVAGGGPANPFAVSSDAYGYNPLYPSLTTNSCFQINQGTAPLSGWNGDSDWFSGGGFSIHADATIGGACTNAKFTGFQYGPICAPAPGVTATVTTDFSGATYSDTGQPVPSSAIYRGP